MTKKILLGALILGASVSFTSCVDDNESPSVTNVRNAKAEQLKALAAYQNAQAQAIIITANAEAQLKAAEAAAKQAEADRIKAQADLLAAQTETEKAKAAQEAVKARIAQAAAEAEIEAAIERAKVQLEQERVALAQAQAELDQLLQQNASANQTYINGLYTSLTQAMTDYLAAQNALIDAKADLAKLQAGVGSVSSEALIVNAQNKLHQAQLKYYNDSMAVVTLNEIMDQAISLNEALEEAEAKLEDLQDAADEADAAIATAEDVYGPFNAVNMPAYPYNKAEYYKSNENPSEGVLGALSHVAASNFMNALQSFFIESLSISGYPIVPGTTLFDNAATITYKDNVWGFETKSGTAGSVLDPEVTTSYTLVSNLSQTATAGIVFKQTVVDVEGSVPETSIVGSAVTNQSIVPVTYDAASFEALIALGNAAIEEAKEGTVYEGQVAAADAAYEAYQDAMDAYNEAKELAEDAQKAAEDAQAVADEAEDALNAKVAERNAFLAEWVKGEGNEDDNDGTFTDGTLQWSELQTKIDAAIAAKMSVENIASMLYLFNWYQNEGEWAYANDASAFETAEESGQYGNMMQPVYLAYVEAAEEATTLADEAETAESKIEPAAQEVETTYQQYQQALEAIDNTTIAQYEAQIKGIQNLYDCLVKYEESYTTYVEEANAAYDAIAEAEAAAAEASDAASTQQDIVTAINKALTALAAEEVNGKPVGSDADAIEATITDLIAQMEGGIDSNGDVVNYEDSDLGQIAAAQEALDTAMNPDTTDIEKAQANVDLCQTKVDILSAQVKNLQSQIEQALNTNAAE